MPMVGAAALLTPVCSGEYVTGIQRTLYMGTDQHCNKENKAAIQNSI